MLVGSQGIDDEQFGDLIKQIDIDGDNQINFEEFERMIKILMNQEKVEAFKVEKPH